MRLLATLRGGGPSVRRWRTALTLAAAVMAAGPAVAAQGGHPLVKVTPLGSHAGEF
jgi:hypothetical protein